MCPTCSPENPPFAFWTSSTISPTLQLMVKLLVFTAAPPSPALAREAVTVPDVVPVPVHPGPRPRPVEPGAAGAAAG